MHFDLRPTCHLSMIATLFCVALMSATTRAHEGHGDHTHEKGSEHGKKIFTTRGDSRTLPMAKEEDAFQFIVYGDRTGGVPEGLRVLEQAVVDTNLLDPDLVMTVGDLVQGYNDTPQWTEQMTEFKGIMDGLNMKWFPVAGNHDVYWRGQTKPPEGQHESSYEKHFGPLWYSFAHKNSAFVVLYSDEGDRETNVKGFSDSKLQTMSEEQLDFLGKALEKHKSSEHVFVFLHHPRWTGGNYSGGNWDVVHEKLKAAGNVSAVFAGHIHHMRYDGPQDGIEYYTLATTGGHLSADIPAAGYLHHLNVVTVRPGGVSVAALAIGSVIDPKEFTPEFLAEIDSARRIRPEQTEHQMQLQPDGSASGRVTFKIQNPAKRAVDLTVSLDQVGNEWKTSLDHEHLTIQPNETKTVEVALKRLPDPETRFDVPKIRLDMEYIGESARIAMPAVMTPVSMRLSSVPADYFVGQPDLCLNLESAADAVRIESSELMVPEGPFTVEGWFNPHQSEGMRGAISKAQGSEFAIFMDEGVPQFNVHLGGNYVTAKATKKLLTDTWVHVAGEYNGSEVRLYVDGKRVGTKSGNGKRTRNELPLYIGADPDESGTASRPFLGQINDVRVSQGALYDEDFSPTKRLAVEESTRLLMHFDRTLGPFVLDHSNSASMGLLGNPNSLVPAE